MNENSIQLFIPYYRTDECLKEIADCLNSGWTGLGYKTLEFENAWCKYSELPNAHFLASATAGLHLALRIFKESYGWNNDDEIITTPFTFISTNHVILHENLKPVFADIDEYLCLDPRSILEKVSNKTKAVMFVGIGGNTGCLEEVAALCQEHGLKLILDAAHMVGTRVKGKHIGSEADVSIFSFHSVKNLPIADGGMICFKDQVLDQEARKWSWLGISKDTYTRTTENIPYKWQYNVEHDGFKYHGNSIMAAIGLVGLRYIDQDNSYRRQVSSWYDKLLAPYITKIPMVPDEPSRHLYQILIDKRDEVILALNEQQIYPGVHYRDNTEYSMYNYANNTCPNATAASEKVLSLPLHLKLSYKDVERVAESLNKITAQVQNKKASHSWVSNK